MDNPYLSLGGEGLITEPAAKVDAILADYSAAQYSQTILYRDIISSLSKDIQLCSDQWEKLPSFMQQSLDRLFSGYFSQADIGVTLDEGSMNAENASFKILITGTLVQGGVPYDLSKMLQISSGKFASVTDFGAGNAIYA